MLKITHIIALLMFISIPAFAQLTFNPAPVSGQIALTASSTNINVTNQGTSAVSTNFTVATNTDGIFISINRCATVNAKQTCQVTISFSNYGKAVSPVAVDFKNGTTVVASFTYQPIAPPPQTSNFSIASLAMDDFNTYSISITNKTSSTKSYMPTFSGTDASKYLITLNRCQSIAPNASCSISIKLSSQIAGSYSASMIESQVTGSILLTSNISGSTPGVLPPPIKTVSVNPTSLNFGTIGNYGQSNQKQIVVITNTGNASLTPIITLSNRVKMVLNRCNAAIAPNKSCSITVTVFVASDLASVATVSNEKIQVKPDASSSSVDIPVSFSTNIVIYCPPGSHQVNADCVSDVYHDTERACLSIPTGQVSGIEYWDSSINTWSGFCSARSQADCDTGWDYNVLAQSCLNTQTGSVNIGTLPSGYSLIKDVNDSMSYGNPFATTHNACTVSSVNPTFVGHTYEILNTSAYPISNSDCNAISAAASNHSIRAVNGYDTCEIKLPVEGKNFLLVKPNSLDPNFCYNLSLNSPSFQSGYKTKYDVFGANPVMLTEFDGRVFYLREMAPLQSGSNQHRILSSTNGTSGNSIDHSANGYNIKAIQKFDNKLYVIAEQITTNSTKTNYLFRLDNSSQILTLSSTPIFSGQTLSYFMKVDNLLVIVGVPDYNYAPLYYLGYIAEGSSTLTQLVNNDRDLVVVDPNSGIAHVEASDFVKVGNKLYSRNPYSEFSDFYDYDINNNYVNYNTIYDVYDLTTGNGQIAQSLQTINNPFGDDGWLTRLFSVGSKQYAMLNKYLYEIDQSTQALTLIYTFDTPLSGFAYGANGSLYINTYKADYSFRYLHKLTSSTSTVSLISGDFPWNTQMTYNEISGKLLLAQDGSYDAKEIDDSGTITTLSSGVHVDAPVANIAGKLYFIGEAPQGSRLFVYSSGSITQLPDLCVNRSSNMSVNSYGKKYNIYYRNFGGLVSFNGSLLFPGNSCQHEADEYNLYGNPTGTLYELYKYTPAP